MILRDRLLVVSVVVRVVLVRVVVPVVLFLGLVGVSVLVVWGHACTPLTGPRATPDIVLTGRHYAGRHVRPPRAPSRSQRPRSPGARQNWPVPAPRQPARFPRIRQGAVVSGRARSLPSDSSNLISRAPRRRARWAEFTLASPRPGVSSFVGDHAAEPGRWNAISVPHRSRIGAASLQRPTLKLRLCMQVAGLTSHGFWLATCFGSLSSSQARGPESRVV